MARRYIRPRLTDQAGNVLEGALLRVLGAGTSTTVDLYAASAGGSVLSQPRSTDARGEVEVWLADGTGDIDLEWSADPGVTTVAASGRTTTFSTFTEFVEAPSGGGASTHAGLPDLATSGHPAGVISGLGGAALLDVGQVAGTVAAGDDSRFTPSGLHADLTDLATSGHPSSVISGLGDAAALDVGTGAGTVAAGDDGRFDDGIPKSLIDAAGDLVYGSADDTPARLGIGTAGQVLTVNSGATAPEWAAAAGGASPQDGPTFLSGRYAGWSGSIDTRTTNEDRGFYVPMPIPRSLTIDRIGVEVTASATGSPLIRLGIYEDSSGAPGTLILDAGTVDASTTGFKEITISQALTAGMVWLVLAQQGGTSNGAVRATRYATHVSIPSSGYSLYEAAAWVDANATTGALAASAPAMNDVVSAAPRFMLRVV